MKIKTVFLFLLGIGVSGFLGYLVLKQTDFVQVSGIFTTDFRLSDIFLALLAYVGFFIAKTYRWHYMLLSYKFIPTKKLIHFILYGYAGNVILPMQLGEAARAKLLSMHYSIKTAPVLSGILVEKFMDLFCILVFMFVTLFFFNMDSSVAIKGLVLLALVLLIASILGIIAYSKKHWIKEFLAKESWEKRAYLSKVNQLIKDMLSGFSGLKNNHIEIVFWTFVMWFLMLCSLYFTISSIGLSVVFPAVILVFFLSVVGIMLPTSPGFLGTIQAVFVIALVPLGYDQNQVIAASIVYNLLVTIPPIIAAAFSFLWLKKHLFIKEKIR